MCFRNRLGAEEKRSRYWNLHRNSYLNEVLGFQTAECAIMETYEKQRYMLHCFCRCGINVVKLIYTTGYRKYGTWNI
jgi:hypothetical protein